MAEYRNCRQINILLALLFAVMGIVIILTVNIEQRKRALSEASAKTRILLEHNLAIHTYFSKILKPKVFQLSDALSQPGYFEPAWMSSTYAVREIDSYYQAISRHRYYYKESAVNARTPGNEADVFEKAFIDALKKDPRLTESAQVREIGGEPYYVLIRRGESMERSCLRCHSTPQAAPADLVLHYGTDRSFNRSEGELVSAISIRIPLKEAYEAANMFSLKLSILLTIIMGIFFLIQYKALNSMLLAPLTRSRQRVMAIIEDEERLGSELPADSASAELNDLTRAFNQLSVNLRREKDNLTEQVHARTAELTRKVTELECAISRVNKLEGIIPICSYCKKIRDDQQSWHKLEEYISSHSDAMFSHGVCPDCFTQLKRDMTPKQ